MACNKVTQSFTGTSNDTDIPIGGYSRGDEEKAGQKAGNVQSIENRRFYETKEEKCHFILESFQLDAKKILNAVKKLKKVVIKLFFDNFEVLAMHPS